MPWSTRALLALAVAFAARLGRNGSLALDEVIVEQAFAKRRAWASWVCSCAQKRTVWGMPIVVLLWCSCDGRWRLPVGVRLWRPKRACRPPRYRTTLELAEQLVHAIVLARLPVRFIVFDTHSTAGWCTKRLARLGLT